MASSKAAVAESLIFCLKLRTARPCVLHIRRVRAHSPLRVVPDDFYVADFIFQPVKILIQRVPIGGQLCTFRLSRFERYFYSYDKKTNSYKRIEKPAYWIDKNGYLRFTTEMAGDIIISEGSLERK